MLKKNISENYSQRYNKTPSQSNARNFNGKDLQFIQQKVLQKNQNACKDFGEKGKKHRRFMSELTEICNYEVQKTKSKEVKKNRRGFFKKPYLFSRKSEANDGQDMNFQKKNAQQEKIFHNYINNLKNQLKLRKQISIKRINQKLRYDRIKQQQQDQPMVKDKYKQCCHILGITFQKIDNLKQLGYSDVKINQWILKYCINSRTYLKDIFMKDTNKSIYNENQDYHYERNREKVQEKIRYRVKKRKDRLSFIEVQELKLYANYIQQILVSKNNIRISEVKSSILQKMSMAAFNAMKRNKTKDFLASKKQFGHQINNFTKELNHYQRKYGRFQQFIKINKLRFDKLNQSQNQIIERYHEILECRPKRQNKKVEYISAFKSTL